MPMHRREDEHRAVRAKYNHRLLPLLSQGRLGLLRRPLHLLDLPSRVIPLLGDVSTLRVELRRPLIELRLLACLPPLVGDELLIVHGDHHRVRVILVRRVALRVDFTQPTPPALEAPREPPRASRREQTAEGVADETAAEERSAIIPSTRLR